MVKDTGSRIRQLRQAKKISISQLSNTIQVSRSLISQVEQGKALPSLPTLERITQALGVSLSEFFQMEETTQVGEEEIIVRRDSRKTIPIPDSRSTYLLLSPSLNSSVEFFMSEFPPGAENEVATRFQHKGEEYFFVLEGDVQLHLGDDVYDLHRGDSGCFNSGTIHNISNSGSELAKIIFVIPQPEVTAEKGRSHRGGKE